MSIFNIKRLINKIFYAPKIKTHGKNNIIDIHKSAYARRVSFDIFGDNNTIQIGEGCCLHNFKIIIGFPNCPIENCVVTIGKNTNFRQTSIQLGESNSRVDIGSNCTFAHGIEVSCTDHHSILDADGNLTNIGKYVSIGSNVWVCRGVTIMKNTTIPNGCVVATRSVVTRNFDQENCIIAGNPAKIVKENIGWSRLRPQNYIRQGVNNESM